MQEKNKDKIFHTLIIFQQVIRYIVFQNGSELYG